MRCNKYGQVYIYIYKYVCNYLHTNTFNVLHNIFVTHTPCHSWLHLPIRQQNAGVTINKTMRALSHSLHYIILRSYQLLLIYPLFCIVLLNFSRTNKIYKSSNTVLQAFLFIYIEAEHMYKQSLYISNRYICVYRFKMELVGQ